MYWIYDIPTVRFGFLCAGFFVAVTWFGIIFVRPFIRLWLRRQPGVNDLVGFTLSGFSVFYGLLLGLLAVAAYQNYSNVDDNVSAEASALVALYRTAGGLPQPVRGQMEDGLRDYVRWTVSEAWPLQQRGIVPTDATGRVARLQAGLQAFEPATRRDEIVMAEALSQLNHFNELRRKRITNVTTGIPLILWAVVLVGAALNIVLIWMFDMRLTVHLILGAIPSLFLGVVVFLIAAMDNPFRGEVSIGPDALQMVYKTVMKGE